jgi:predicted enzyme related to lactoylglutathione lyase
MAEEAPKPGSIVHVEIPCKDPESAKKFYGEVFGWEFKDVPELNYTLFEPANPPSGGLRVPSENDPGGILNYILVDSIDGSLEKIEAAGGKVLMPKGEVPDIGWWALFQDPEGNVLALWKSKPGHEE